MVAKSRRAGDRPRGARHARGGGEDFQRSGLRSVLVGGVAIKIAALILVIAPGGYDSFQQPKAVVSAVIGVVLLAGLALALVRYGLRIVPRTRLHGLVAAFLLVNLLSALVAEDRHNALFGDSARLQGLTFVADMTVLYATVSIAFIGRPDWRVLGTVAGVAALLAAAYGMLQFAGIDPVPWSANPRSRTFSTFGNSNIFGHFLGLAFGAAIGLALVASGQRLRVGAVVLAIAAVIVSVTTGTRGVLVGFAAALVGAAFVYVRLRGASRQTGARVVASAAGVTVAGAAIMLATPLGRRVVGSFTGEALLVDRLLIWDAAWRAFLARPILGWGPDNFAPAYISVRSPEMLALFGPRVIHTSAHDSALHAAATLGVVGLAALVALIAVCGWRLSRVGLSRDPLVASPLLLAFVAYWAQGGVTVGSVAVDWLPWLVFGGAAAAGAHRPAASFAARRLPRRLNEAVLLCATASGILGWPAFQANLDAGFASVATGAPQRVPLAVERASAAVARDPGRARYWNIQGNALATAGRYAQAEEAFATAAAKAPYHFEYWANLAKARTARATTGDRSGGGLGAALAAIEEGLRRDPSNAFLHETLAIVQGSFGQHDAALSSAVQALRLHRGDRSYDDTIATVARAADARVAQRLVEDAVALRDSAILRVAAGRASLRAGDRTAAAAHARRALELDPQSAHALELMREASAVPP